MIPAPDFFSAVGNLLATYLAPEGLPSENLIVLDLDNHHASARRRKTGCRFSYLNSYSQPDSFPRITGRSARSRQGQKIMKTLLYILKKDGNGKGPFRWVEAVNDIDTAEARVRQLSAESQDEYLVLRNIDLRVVATYSENTYKRL